MIKLLHAILLSALLVTCLFMTGCGVVSSADRKISQADELLNNGKRLKATQHIYAAIALDPSRCDTYSAAMQVYESHGYHADSARVCSLFVRRAIGGKLDRKLHRVEIAQWAEVAATGFHQAKLFAEAESLYLLALKQDPDNAMVWNDLGYLYAEYDKNLDQALVLTRRAASAISNDGNVLDSLGWVYYKKKNYKLAEETLREAVMLSPDVPEIRYHLGATYIKMDRVLSARIELSKALALNPGMPHASKLLALHHN